MANTIVTTNRTIEVSDIDADYLLPDGLDVWSVHFLSETASDEVYIIEGSLTGPVKCRLQIVADEPRDHYFFGQRLKLGFLVADGTFGATSKVIFNIGERGY